MRSAALCLMLALCGPIATFAGAAGGGEDYAYREPANNHIDDVDSLRRGARNFMNYCSGCHSAQYVRYNTLAGGLGLTDDQILENLMFNADKLHDTITASMPPAAGQRWFGRQPPDMSLVARSRGTQYIYNFLRAFYLDPSKPSGVDNMELPGASMPHVLWEFQGLQKAVYREETHDGEPREVFEGFEQVTQGTLSADEYDRFVRDTVNFLSYISEPVQLKRRVIGVWVMLFLAFFLIIAYMLKKQIWSDVK